jgi:hypothetical protein
VLHNDKLETQIIQPKVFWALLAALITSLFTALVASNDTVVQGIGVIGAFGAVIVYILAEAYE